MKLKPGGPNFSEEIKRWKKQAGAGAELGQAQCKLRIVDKTTNNKPQAKYQPEWYEMIKEGCLVVDG